MGAGSAKMVLSKTFFGVIIALFFWRQFSGENDSSWYEAVLVSRLNGIQ